MTQASSRKVLILGSGGREHALVNACLASPLVERVAAAPGNGGMETVVDCFALDIQNPQAVLELVQAEDFDWVIIGPEAPMTTGLADTLRDAGIAVYGPGKKGAELEASKAVCKRFLADHQIPTADYAHFQALEPALAYLKACKFPTVVKASGLAAGKGVIICEDEQQAEAAVRDMMEHGKFGDSGSEIVIEEFLEGEELSLMVLISGDQFVCLPPSQDHKRIGEGDTGPNTGGMGAYAPLDLVDEPMMQSIEETVIKPTIKGLAAESIDFRGTLFIGLMLTKEGPKVLEFNVRFGDPECQVLLPLCETDPVDLMLAVSEGRLKPETVRIRPGASIIVVIAAQGYPGDYTKGEAIGLPESLPEGVHIVHAGTKRSPTGQLLSNGGRVLGVVAHGKNLRAAAAKAYAVCDQIEWPGATFRRDIGWRQLAREG